jgi:hypothetical protein
LRWYNADTQTWAHRDRALREGNHAALRWEALRASNRWTSSTPDERYSLSLHEERAAMVVDDLRRLPHSPLVVAEGSTVLPAVVTSGVADRSQAVWLMPTREVQQRQLDERGTPTAAKELYLLTAQAIEYEVHTHSAPLLTVDGSREIEETLSVIEERFAAALSAGPRAETRADRRELLREANRAIAGQIRGYYARPWAEGDVETVVRAFLCECGERDCTAWVEVTVAEATRPVLAPGHT